MDNKKRKRSKKKKMNSKELPKHLSRINLNAAGIDVGSEAHYVAVPEGSDKSP